MIAQGKLVKVETRYATLEKRQTPFFGRKTRGEAVENIATVNTSDRRDGDMSIVMDLDGLRW